MKEIALLSKTLSADYLTSFCWSCIIIYEIKNNEILIRLAYIKVFQMDKYEFTCFLMKKNHIEYSDIVDIGCRDRKLKEYLSDNINYFGIDVSNESNCDEIIDISQKTRFLDRQFQLLIALDVAEHTDNIYFAISEMLRISKVCIIALPNMYKFGMRLRFVMGRTLCNKYALSIKNALSDGYRHRWIFTPDEAISFMKQVAKNKNYDMTFYYYYAELRWPLNYLQYLLPANLSAEALYFILKPTNK